MPIAFDPPAHAPHGNLHARPARAQDDDDASLDMFTQLLLAAANVQDAAASDEASMRPAKDDAAATADAPLLALPLPPVNGAAVQPGNLVTIIGTEGPAAARLAAAGAGVRRALGHGTESEKPALAGASSAPGARDERTTRAPTGFTASTATATAHADAHRDTQASQAPALTTDPASNGAPGSGGKTHAEPASAATALAALLAAPIVAMPDKPAASKGTLEAVAAVPQPAATPALATAPATVVETVAAPAFTPGWQDETVSKLAQIVLTRNERAELRLNPAELGPVHVRVELRADQASVQIVAASPETRSALEQSLPQLRDLLATQGITLGQASVHDGASQREARPDMWASTRMAAPAAGAAAPAETIHLVVRQPNRLVDVFA